MFKGNVNVVCAMKTAVVVLAVFAYASVAGATVIFDEPFSGYSAGDLNGQGSWSTQTGTATVEATGLSYLGLPSSGGAALMTAGTNYEKLDGDVGDMYANAGTYYGTALIQVQVPRPGRAERVRYPVWRPPPRGC